VKRGGRGAWGTGRNPARGAGGGEKERGGDTWEWGGGEVGGGEGRGVEGGGGMLGG